MENKMKKYFLDILEAIERIETYFDGCQDFLQYEGNMMLKDATERNLEIIGEAMNKILQLDPLTKISDGRKIVNTRNKLIHGYDSVDNAEVYVIVKKYLPVLKSEVKYFLR
jgi:uncharacterized protein with HEPN domain